MKARLLFILLFLVTAVPRAQAQQSYLAPAGTDIGPQAAELQEALSEDPDNIDLNLELANLYCSVADAENCERYVGRVIELGPQTDAALRARQAAMFGYYAAGFIRKSFDMAQEAVALDPRAEPAASFVTMLQTARDSFWNGEIPEKISWYGYRTANEFILAAQTVGVGMMGGANGEDTDCILTRGGRQICWTSIPSWFARQNAILSNGTRALLMYTSTENQPVPSIGITVDNVPAGIERAVDYARRVAKAMKGNEGVTIRGPEEVNVQGFDASLMWLELPQGMRSAWYQFLFDKQIVSVQLMTTDSKYELHHELLKAFIDSMEIGASAVPMGSINPPAVAP